MKAQSPTKVRFATSVEAIDESGERETISLKQTQHSTSMSLIDIDGPKEYGGELEGSLEGSLDIDSEAMGQSVQLDRSPRSTFKAGR